jgi:hypothetical protein
MEGRGGEGYIKNEISSRDLTSSHTTLLRGQDREGQDSSTGQERTEELLSLP